MSRWDNDNFDKERYDLTSDNEETNLLKKFDDYKKLERTEFEKIKISNFTNSEKNSNFRRYFHPMAVFQGILIIGFAGVSMVTEVISSDIKFLILSITAVVLSGEIIFISFYLRKKAKLDARKSLMQFQNETEFEKI